MFTPCTGNITKQHTGIGSLEPTDLSQGHMASHPDTGIKNQ